MSEDVVGGFGVGGVEYLVHSGGCHDCVFDDLCALMGRMGVGLFLMCVNRSEPSGSSI